MSADEVLALKKNYANMYIFVKKKKKKKKQREFIRPQTPIKFNRFRRIRARSSLTGNLIIQEENQLYKNIHG